MNPRIFSGAALAGALFVATFGPAAAQSVAPGVPGPYPGAPGAYPGPVSAHQYNSNQNIGSAANRAGHLMMALQRDERDYGGHRVAAINDLGNARNELTAAQQFAEAHGYYTQPAYPAQPLPEKPRRHDQKRSNYSIGNVREVVQRMIGHLQRDTRDYGGHRVNAINWLEQASNELGAAEQFEQTRPNG